MRLIDADSLEKEVCHGCQYEHNKYANCIDCAIANAPTVDRWIPVKERLPEKSGNYLVTGKWKSEPHKIWICEFMNGIYVSGWMNHALNPVVEAWMPLPEPYGGVKTDETEGR